MSRTKVLHELRGRLVVRVLVAGVLALPVLISPAADVSARPWVPVDCEERLEEVAAIRERRGIAATSWRDHERAVRSARPGDPLHVPHPFPATDQQVLADFRHGYFGRLFDDMRRVPEEERPIFEALRAGQLGTTVLRVENWEHSRCSADRPIPFHHLVVLAEPGGRERARAIVHATGVLGRYARLTRLWSLPGTEDLEPFLAAELGVELSPRDAQLVALQGVPVPCDAAFPCVAFRAGADVYLLAPGPLLYRIPPNAPRRSVLEEWERRGAEVRLDREVETPWVSVGFGWARARRVAGRLGGEEP